jgi:hypothetical protein
VGTFSAQIAACDEDTFVAACDEDTFVAACDEDTFVATAHRRIVDEPRTGDSPEDQEFARTVARWSSCGLHRTAVSLLAGRPATFREQLGAFAGPRRYISGALSDEDLEPLRALGCEVVVVPAAGHVLMWDNLDGLADALR